MKDKNHWIYTEKGGLDFRFKINNSLDIVVQIYKQIEEARPTLSLRSQLSLRSDKKDSGGHKRGTGCKHTIDTIYYYQSWKYVQTEPAKKDKKAKLKTSKTKFLEDLDE